MADPRGDLPQHDVFEPGPGLRAMQAMVDTLLDGAPPELAADMREELPDPLKGSVRPYNAEAPASVGDLLDRFRQRADLTGDDVLHEAKVAVRLLGQMLTDETFGDLRGSFPPEFGVLFERHAS